MLNESNDWDYLTENRFGNAGKGYESRVDQQQFQISSQSKRRFPFRQVEYRTEEMLSAIVESGQMATQEIVVPVGRWNALRTILLAGFVAGVLDGLDAAILLGWARGIPVLRIFQFIASGILGVKAFTGGLDTALLGCGLHFLIATSVAAAYYALSLKIPALLRKPVIFGPLYGLGVFLLMHYLVVPLSAAPKQPPSAVGPFLNLVFAHLVFIGLPIGLITSYPARYSSRCNAQTNV